MASARELVFLDASLLIAASGSSTGGSAVAMEVCQGRKFRAVLSERVLLEARENISGKMGENPLVRFYKLLADLNPVMAPAATKAGLGECAEVVGAKDAHVLASAIESGAGYLLTLDRRHFLNARVRGARLKVRIMTPGEFLKGLVGSS
ncbi:MAG: PIN domain-containing protein [SAR202 cluster bacterium]|nr:PIN domain-containing protein [SAR202 cluster bacterium]